MGFRERRDEAKAAENAREEEKLENLTVRDIMRAMDKAQSIGNMRPLDNKTTAIVDAININTKVQLLVLQELRRRSS